MVAKWEFPEPLLSFDSAFYMRISSWVRAFCVRTALAAVGQYLAPVGCHLPERSHEHTQCLEAVLRTLKA
ncbi:hypothetical protein PAXRUDRAFT_831209 [Paxillus rubicundulus Ve08.2h10]|uniref:Uncharacterized protein n=1 Tax=Paxillus rubicundulus Ve08.2h10 TaxID=930991 RepID=A0A0D0E2H6_9AGAM|nr:hypothetical protein PAXRUDRAFT_831209 [Paxillus rubicundulus Ve08.2h10]